MLRLRYGLDYGRLVRERRRFAANEALNGWKIGTYRLCDGNATISLRHHPSPHGSPSIDTWVLREIFRDGAYEIPNRVSLPPGPKIVDLGANIGLFTAFMFARYPKAQITAFEPDQDNARLLRGTARRNGYGDRLSIHEAAAMPYDGMVRFATGRHQFSGLVGDADSTAVDVAGVDVFPFLSDVDLLKMDIEGAEWALLGDARFGAARSVVLEYHPMMCPSPDPGALVKKLLVARGYEIIVDDEPMVWATLASSLPGQ